MITCEHKDVAPILEDLLAVYDDPDDPAAEDIQRGICRECGLRVGRILYNESNKASWGIDYEDAVDLYGEFDQEGWSPWRQVEQEHEM